MRGALLSALLLAHYPASALQLSSCTVTPTPISFGGYDPTQPNISNNSGAVRVNCTVSSGKSATSFSIQLTIAMGTNSTSATQRRLKGASNGDFLNYNVYTDSGYQIIWPSAQTSNTQGNFRTMTPVAQGGSGVNTTYSSASTEVVFTLHARIDGGQYSARPDSYSDSLALTVYY